MTPLMLATKKRSEQLLNVLIHAGADVNAQSKDVCMQQNFIVLTGSTSIHTLVHMKTYVTT